MIDRTYVIKGVSQEPKRRVLAVGPLAIGVYVHDGKTFLILGFHW
jgi:hypothetical protein